MSQYIYISKVFCYINIINNAMHWQIFKVKVAILFFFTEWQTSNKDVSEDPTADR